MKGHLTIPGIPERYSGQIIKVLKQTPIQVATLFGSRAIGTFKNGSDIDIAVSGNLGAKDFGLILVKIDELELPWKIDLLNFEKLNNTNLIDHIKNKGKVIYENYMKDWKVVKLGEVAKVQTGPFGTQLHMEDYVDSGVPIITVEHLGDNRIVDENTPLVDEESYLRLQKYTLKSGDIVFSRVGSVDRRSLVRDKEEGWLFSGRLLRVRPDAELLSGEFLSYFFGLESFKSHIRAIAVGATMPSLNTEILSSITIPLPPLPTQRRIADILGSLDEKIALNHEMSKTLEQIAQTLFRHWFVDFEFPDANGKPYKSSGGKMVPSELGEIPEGWRVGKIGEVYVESVGGDWGKEEPEEKYNVGVHIIRGTDIPDIKSNTIGKIPYRYIQEKKALTRVLTVGDIILEISGGSKEQPTGRTLLITKEIYSRFEKVIPASFCRLLRPLTNYNYYLGVFHDIFYDEGKTWEHQNQSTGISNFQLPHFLDSVLLSLPPENILLEFNLVIEPIYEMIYSNNSQTLSTLRDSLLPRLMKGELKV